MRSGAVGSVMPSARKTWIVTPMIAPMVRMVRPSTSESFGTSIRPKPSARACANTHHHQ